MKNDITILTLFAGRFNCLAPFLHGLDNLEYGKKNLHLVWCTNAEDQLFVEALQREFEKRKKFYKSANMYIIPLKASRRAFVERATGTSEHAEVMSKIYQFAYDKVKTRYFLCLEDDVMAPPHSINQLMKHMNDDVGVSGAVVMDRHKEQSVMVWDLKKVKVPRPEYGGYSIEFQPVELKKKWGAQSVGAVSTSCTIIDKEKADRLSRSEPFFEPRSFFSTPMFGCDLVICMKMKYGGYDVIADYDVRPNHMDSNGTIH